MSIDIKNVNKSNTPIGVFDSGVGGLSVVKSIMQKLPNEDIVYFGDIARLPYGNKSATIIKKFAHQTVKFLINKQVKAIVIACNTISSVATESIRQIAGDIPVIDVISAGALATINSNANKVAVIATPATINSQAYPKAIHDLNNKINVISKACPLFVPMIEENFIQHKALELVAEEYLNPLLKENLDAVILGCTHYPLIRNIVQAILGNKVMIIDPADKTSDNLINLLKENLLLNSSTQKASHKFFVTDIPTKFQEIGELFLQTKMEQLELVSLD